MSTISSRGATDAVKIDAKHPRTKYCPQELTDDAVYMRALHWYSLDEIAADFNVDPNTILNNYREAYTLGRQSRALKPRVLLAKILNDFDDPEINFARKDANTDTLLATLKLWFQKYEKLGSNTPEVATTNALASLSTADLDAFLASMGYVKQDGGTTK